MVAPARQVVRRPVVQMVGSRHSSLSAPSTTETATVAAPWLWAAVTNPAGHPRSQASASAVTSRGTDHGRSAGPAATGRASWARLAVSWTSSAGRVVVVVRERMRASFDAGEQDGRPARAGGSPQQVGGAGRRARGHAQDPIGLEARLGWPLAAFRCGMASGRVPSAAPAVKPGRAR